MLLRKGMKKAPSLKQGGDFFLIFIASRYGYATFASLRACFAMNSSIVCVQRSDFGVLSI